MRTRKLQVFISSTFTDLKQERQAAVEAVLMAGHIPAGMELFAAGDEEQLTVIRRWIDESDAFMLILGARYGSIEPKSGKSYIELEYSYAVQRHKPLFAVVIDSKHIDEHVRARGPSSRESDHAEELRAFRDLVGTRMIRFWSDEKDVKLAILETLREIAERPDVVGWVRANEVPQQQVLDELARLSSENSALRDRLAAMDSQEFAGLTFGELKDMLAARRVDVSRRDAQSAGALKAVANALGEEEPSLLHALVYLSRILGSEQRLNPENAEIAQRLEDCGVVSRPNPAQSSRAYRITEDGRRFLVRLRRERDLSQAELHRL